MPHSPNLALRIIRLARAGGLLLLFAIVAVGPATAANFTVNDGGWSHDDNPGDGTCADDAPTPKCTLNAAIEEGNFLAGAVHNITFAPSVLLVDLSDGSLAQLRAKYTVTGNLPVRTVIDGAGISGCFSLADSGDPGTGHELGADGSTLANLVIQNCNSHGISANGHGYTFINNYIGVDSTGLVAAPNDGSGISISASREYGNLTDQLLVDLANQIPMLPASDADILAFSQQLNTVLAAADLGPVIIAGNVISGNVNHGVEIFSENLAGVFVGSFTIGVDLFGGNMIGTDLTGNIAIPNGESGVRLVGSPFANMIGPGNVISGNTVHGIDNDALDVALPNFVMGNRIGLSLADPSANIGNGLSGITVDSKPDTDVGHINPTMISFVIGPFNVISDNKGANNTAFPDVLQDDSAGILVTGDSDGVKVVGNLVGLGEFPPGTVVSSSAYGNAGDGIIVTVPGVAIGGSGAVDGNVIAGNVRHGLVIRGSETKGISVLGNSIGVHPDLTDDLTVGNGFDGIHLSAASTSVIGGTGSTDFNVIAANGRNGVKLKDGNFNNGWGNLLQRNRIFGNGINGTGIGIDLDRVQNDDDPTTDTNPDDYANLGQPAPHICTGDIGDPPACSGASGPGDAGGETSFEWTIVTHGPGTLPTTYRIEFFSIDAASVNAATSMTFLGEDTVTADLFGVLDPSKCPSGLCGSTVAAPSAGTNVVMTVTDVTEIPDTVGGGWLQLVKCLFLTTCNINNTSEFSNVAESVAVPVDTSTAVTQVNPSSAVFGQSVEVTVTVTAQSGLVGPNGSVTVDTGAGSCIAALGAPVGLVATGSCTLSAPAVSGSPYTVTASYPGNAAFAASSSNGVADGTLTVSAADTTTAITGDSPDPSFVGAPVLVTAVVSVSAPGAGTPTGSITVSDGTAAPDEATCVITLPATSCNLVPTTSGAKTITAMYTPGDGNFNGSSSAGESHQVDAAGATATTTAITLVDPNTIVFGQPVTVTVTVTAGAGVDEPTGTVSVNVNGSSCPATLAATADPVVASGSCILSPAPGVAGSPYDVNASYAGDASFAPSNATTVVDGLTVNQASTTTSITSDSPDPSNAGAQITVAAGVAVTPPGSGSPSGTITVSDSVDNCVITLPNPSCNLTLTTAGARTLTASYSGDANFAGGASVGEPHQVNAGGATATATAVTNVNPGTSVFGQTVNVSVSVTAQSGTDEPTGSVTVNAGASSCVASLGASATTTATGACNLAPPPPASGSAYTVIASYAGNATFAASSSSGLADGTLTVNQASTNATLGTHTPNPSFVNGPIAVNASVAPVAPGAGTPTGTITVSDGTDSCVITLPATSCNLTPTTSGAKTLVATYNGDSNFLADASPGVAHTVNPAGSVVTTSAVTLVNPGTIVFGQAVAVTASVTAQSGTDEPTGNVTLSAGASSCIVALGTSATTTATATCNLAPPPGVGGSPYTVTAGYGGSATFAASSSSGGGNGALTVNQASTTTTIGSDLPDPSNVGVPIAVIASVSVQAPGAGTPTGTITVSDGTDNCVITLPATSCNLVPTTSGAKTLIANYGGDVNFVQSTSAGVPHQVNSGGSIATTTAVTLVNPAVAVYGQTVAVTASVTRSGAGVAPNGSVTISAGGSSCIGTLQSPAVNTSTATCNLAPPLLPSGGAYVVSATYAGTPTFAPSASSGGTNGSLDVNPAATTTAITAHTPNPSFVLTPIAVTATVAATPPGAGTPTGTITVSDGTDNCVITLPATSCNLTPTTAGPKTLVATYGGEARFLGSASVGTAHTVDLLTVFSGPTATPGVTATVTLTGGLQGCTMVDPAFIPVAPLVPPLGVQFPFGLFEFTTAGCGTGETISIEIVYSEALPADAQYWKYGPTPGGGDNSLPHWYLLPGATVAGAVVTFDITDGLIGDDDLLANGEIVDQGGPGGSVVAEIPTASGWALVLMALALLGVGWRATRGLGGRG